MLQLIGTFLPIASIILTAILGYKFEGERRWLALFATPIIVMAPCYIYALEIANNGNLLFGIMFGFAVIVWIAYYPILIITGIVLKIKARH